MERIDSHHHLWFYDPQEYPWIDDRMQVLRRNFLPEEFEREFQDAGITGAIPVQAHQSWRETWQLLQFANDCRWIRGVVGWLPLTDPEFERKLPTLADHPKLKGVRHVVHDEPDPNFILREDFNRGISELLPHGLPYDILIFERHLPQTIEFVDRHPKQIFILDHIAKPKIAAGEISPWRENIEELARRPNVYCKLSGMVTEANWTEWTEETLKPYFEVVFEAFGPRRLMFGSDWPVCLVAAAYLRWVQVVERAIAGFSRHEQQRIWSGTAIEAYRLHGFNVHESR